MGCFTGALFLRNFLHSQIPKHPQSPRLSRLARPRRDRDEVTSRGDQCCCSRARVTPLTTGGRLPAAVIARASRKDSVPFLVWKRCAWHGTLHDYARARGARRDAPQQFPFHLRPSRLGCEGRRGKWRWYVRYTQIHLTPTTVKRSWRGSLKHDPWWHPWLFFLFWTGMRHGEAAALRWGDIDVKPRIVSISRSRDSGEENAPKTSGSVREIPLLPWVIDLVERLTRGGGSGSRPASAGRRFEGHLVQVSEKLRDQAAEVLQRATHVHRLSAIRTSESQRARGILRNACSDDRAELRKIHAQGLPRTAHRRTAGGSP